MAIIAIVIESYRISSEVSMPSLYKRAFAFFAILWIVQKKVLPLQIVMNEHKIINDPVFGFIKIRPVVPAPKPHRTTGSGVGGLSRCTSHALPALVRCPAPDV